MTTHLIFRASQSNRTLLSLFEGETDFIIWAPKSFLKHLGNSVHSNKWSTLSTASKYLNALQGYDDKTCGPLPVSLPILHASQVLLVLSLSFKF